MIDDRELVTLALRRRVEDARRRMLPASHSTVEEIAAYYEGEMPEEQGRELQRHLVLCRDCPDLLLDLDGFVHLPATKEGDAPPGLKSVWARLRRQLAEEERSRARRPVPAEGWRTRIHLLAAALLLFLASLGLLLLRTGSEPVRRVGAPERGLPQWEVAAAVRGGEESPAIGDRRAAAGFTLVASPEGPWDAAAYQVELRRLEGGRPWTWSWWPGSPSAPFFLAVPRGALPAGEYRLRFVPRPKGPVEERRFRLSYR